MAKDLDRLLTRKDSSHYGTAFVSAGRGHADAGLGPPPLDRAAGSSRHRSARPRPLVGALTRIVSAAATSPNPTRARNQAAAPVSAEADGRRSPATPRNTSTAAPATTKPATLKSTAEKAIPPAIMSSPVVPTAAMAAAAPRLAHPDGGSPIPSAQAWRRPAQATPPAATRTTAAANPKFVRAQFQHRTPFPATRRRPHEHPRLPMPTTTWGPSGRPTTVTAPKSSSGRESQPLSWASIAFIWRRLKPNTGRHVSSRPAPPPPTAAPASNVHRHRPPAMPSRQRPVPASRTTIDRHRYERPLRLLRERPRPVHVGPDQVAFDDETIHRRVDRELVPVIATSVTDNETGAERRSSPRSLRRGSRRRARR